MKRKLGYSSVFTLACSAAMIAGLAATAFASPNPNSAVINERIFNDCPGSTLVSTNLYPASIAISDDAENTCTNWANLHNWRFSENGTDPALFANGDVFRFSADMVIDGPGQAESGLMVSPWWSPNVDGRFNVRSTDGEIAAFGGVLPFFSFTGAYGLHYVKGTLIHLEVNYSPRGNSEANPALIEYKLVYGGQFYSSGLLPFTNCTPSEQAAFGCYGDLNFAQAGGHFQPLWVLGGNQQVATTWSNIAYSADEKPTAAVRSSWGHIKSIYR